MTTRYVLDTSFWINGWQKHYPYDCFPRLWEVIDQKMREGVLLSCEDVYSEIVYQDDDLAVWVKERKDLFEVASEDLIHSLKYVMKCCPQLGAESKSKNSADPWVIAHAYYRKAILVTYETPGANVSSTKPPKIPDVCEMLGISWVTPTPFIKHMREFF